MYFEFTFEYSHVLVESVFVSMQIDMRINGNFHLYFKEKFSGND